MKLLAIMLFSAATGIISAYCGLLVVHEPVKYLLINMPLIACFAVVVPLLPVR